MFNSVLIYELAVLKQFADPLLFQIDKGEPEYYEDKRLLKFLEYFLGVTSESLPNNSCLLYTSLPIVLLVTAVVEAVTLCIRRLPMSFLTGALYLISGIAVLCVGLELLIDRYLRQEIMLGWSAIVLTVCVIVDITIATLLSRRRLRNADVYKRQE